MSDIRKLDHYLDVYTKLAFEPFSASAIGIYFTVAFIASAVAGSVRSKMDAGFVDLEAKLKDLVTTIYDEKPSDGWGKHHNLMETFINQAKFLAATAKAVHNPPAKPDKAYMDKVNKFISDGTAFMNSYYTVEGALTEMQSWIASVGDVVTGIFGEPVRTDLGHIKAIWPGIQTTLGALIEQLNQAIESGKLAAQQAQKQQQAAPAAAGPAGEDEQVLGQLADLSI